MTAQLVERRHGGLLRSRRRRSLLLGPCGGQARGSLRVGGRTAEHAEFHAPAAARSVGVVVHTSHMEACALLCDVEGVAEARCVANRVPPVGEGMAPW